jgi:hypothetical protein
MGGKRPDQYRRAAGAPDAPTRADDEHFREEDKQELSSNPEGQPMIPKAGTNPAIREMLEQKQGKPSPGDEEE